MNHTINFTNKPSAQDLESISNGLEKHAKQKMGKTSFEPFGFLVHHGNEKLIAGCTGVLMYGALNIKLLWVSEIARGNGLGKQLIEKTESFAKENKCRFITLETFDWQAKGFYEKMGYNIELVYEGYDDNCKFYFFRKQLL